MYVSFPSGQTPVQFFENDPVLMSSICKTVVVETLGEIAASILEQTGGPINEKMIYDLQGTPDVVSTLLMQAAAKGDAVAENSFKMGLAPVLSASLSRKLDEKLAAYAKLSVPVTNYINSSDEEEQKEPSENSDDQNVGLIYENPYQVPPASPNNSLPISSLDFEVLSIDDNGELLAGIFVAAINQALGSSIAKRLVEKADGDPAILEKTFREFREDHTTLGSIIKECAAGGDEIAKSFITIRDDKIIGSDHLFTTQWNCVDILIAHFNPHSDKAFVQYHLGLLYLEKGSNQFSHGMHDDAMTSYLAAFHNLNLASTQGYLNATYELGNLYLFGHETAKKYQSIFISQNAPELAQECYKKAARGGHLLAIQKLLELGITNFSEVLVIDQMEEERDYRPRSPSSDDFNSSHKKNRRNST